MSTAGFVTVLAPAANAYTVPPTTLSYYEKSTSTSNAYAQGENAAKNSQRGWVILDFGRPALNGTTYGTIDFGGHFDSFSSIATAMKSYADGYWNYSNHNYVLHISMGTNDSCQPKGYCYTSNGVAYYCGVNTTCSYEVPNANFVYYGKSWGSNVNTVANYIASAPAYTNEYGDGADDAEPGWDSEYTQTSNALSGYNNATGEPMADFGSLDGGPCCSAWTAAQQYQIAYGYADDVPFGEIYTSGQASQWTALDKWAVQNKGGAMYVFGVTTENGYSGTYTTSQSYNVLMTDLHNCACGISQDSSPIPYETII